MRACFAKYLIILVFFLGYNCEQSDYYQFLYQ